MEGKNFRFDSDIHPKESVFMRYPETNSQNVIYYK